ncbi:hypothetical protein BDM02DRAFT_3097287 [Thelephora ganbajun]|uniref:Uncharacterized protein n=1 Tax=Thelephora ganbajun TaxID=370292 RepID=A0ACB6ZE62_THEGA|nr:hypothetical protein BDM02DRAFT_3097287 [Thelephora ganbajun]
MSRLIIKNLPPYLTPSALRKHFSGQTEKNAASTSSSSKIFTLTDAKIAYKPDGTSRRFGFVGFKTEKEAEEAKRWFDKSFIDSMRISVEVVDVSSLQRPAKRRKLEPDPSPANISGLSPPISRKGKKFEPNGERKPAHTDGDSEEYHKMMQPRAVKGPSWMNEPQLRPAKKVKGAGVKHNQIDVDPTPPQDALSDLEWMRQRMAKSSVGDSGTAAGHLDLPPTNEAGTRQVRPCEAIPFYHLETSSGDPTRDTILRTARLFVRNLAYSCTNEDLTELFKPFGEISQVHIPIDRTTKEPKGVAYVAFASSSSALSAYESLDKKSFQGRLLHILGAVDRKGSIYVEDGEAKTIKGEKDAKRKAGAGKEFNWGMLYMNSDAVASSVADRMRISKSDILNPESENAAVKLALAETHIINETKTYLESQGVLLDSFSTLTSSRVRRSDTVILVKNIPYGTSVATIREMFEAHGELSRVLIPPAGTIAVVEFIYPDEAVRAFKAVAYRRLGNTVVYLEKGPVGIFKEPASTIIEGGSATVVSSGVKPVTIPDEKDTADEPKTPISGGTTLFVKNLAFSTTTEGLDRAFRGLPAFAFARVQMKPDPKKPGGKLSMGYGFVGFKDVEGAKKALKSMQGYVLDGHSLSVRLAGRGVEEPSEGKGKTGGKSSTKMIVKNVPFEASKKDIKELFGAHGQLRSVRLPKKLDHRSRGFAFLEFASKHEAESAFNSLQYTHLLGRHLVLQWAEENEQDVDSLRRKAGVGYGDGAEVPGKKRKLIIGGDDQDGEGGFGDDE